MTDKSIDKFLMLCFMIIGAVIYYYFGAITP